MTWPEAGDTIVAISTPPGEAGIGIVRLSGPQAAAIAQRLFHPRRPHSPWQSHRLYLGHILDSQGQVLDEVLLTHMRAPHTYTREDVVEIHCHSGYAVLKTILTEVLAQGARLARPGEFTLRAFLSGRLDLSQAEAVLEVIEARTQASLRVAAGHLAGGLGRRPCPDPLATPPPNPITAPPGSEGRLRVGRFSGAVSQWPHVAGRSSRDYDSDDAASEHARSPTTTAPPPDLLRCSPDTAADTEDAHDPVSNPMPPET